jgi:hypothetical protein
MVEPAICRELLSATARVVDALSFLTVPERA